MPSDALYFCVQARLLLMILLPGIPQEWQPLCEPLQVPVEHENSPGGLGSLVVLFTADRALVLFQTRVRPQDEFDEKQKEVEKTVNPIMSKLYAAGGAGGGDGGGDDEEMPDHDEL